MHTPETLTEMLMVAGGLLMIVAAGAALFMLRRDPDALRVSVAFVGRISTITCSLTAIALAGIGYHLLVHALRLPQFRAPLGVAVAVGVVAVVGSLLVDLMEHRLDRKHADDDSGGA